MTAQTFEQVITLAQADGGLNPAFKKFLQTRFFVPISNVPRLDLQLALHVGSEGLIISEVAERVPALTGQSATVSLAGADIVRQLQADADILIALSDRAFTIARDRVQWLKQIVEAAHAKAEAQKAAAVPVPPAPTPAPAAAPLPAVPSAPVSMVKPAPAKRAEVLDVAALHPRTIMRTEIGLSLFIPGTWTDMRNARSTFATDPVGGTRIEISGSHRPGMTLDQWVAMRTAQVGFDQRFLTRVGESYPIDGDDWRGRIRGMATEFIGVFPGEETESRYLVACIWTEGTVVSVAIRALADEFENKRSLYKWLLSRVDLPANAPLTTDANVYSAPRANLDANPLDSDDCYDPPIFGRSLRGRIGRLRSIAYCFPLAAAVALLGALSENSTNSTFSIIMVLITGAVVFWSSLRLTVLRLHDVNLSGKLAFIPFFAMMFASVIMKSAKLYMAFGAISLLLMFLLYYILPGTKGENNFGLPPSPNTLPVKIGAFLLIGLQVASVIVALVFAGPALYALSLLK